MKLFLTNRFYYCSILLVILFVAGQYFPLIYTITHLIFWIFLSLVGVDCFLLFFKRKGLEITRVVQDKLSNGDENNIQLHIQSNYQFPIKVSVLEDLPAQLQIRDFQITIHLDPGVRIDKAYSIFPKNRGVYSFGYSNALVTTPLGLMLRRYKSANPIDVKVYPSFVRISNLELAAISNQLLNHGQKRIRKVGNSQEFDNIRSYVSGDDPRLINWKATAKKGALHVNHFMDEKSQEIYSLIDMSRSMKMPFDGMTLVDYSINSSLGLSYVALNKGDRSGLITFEDKPSTFIKATGQNTQIHNIMEALYKEETSFNEVDFTSLYGFVAKKISQRSLLLLYSNFESIHSLERQLPYLKLLNRKHLLLVIFFRNTEVDTVIEEEIKSVENIYQKAIAYQMTDEKHLINDSLQRAGILTLFTRPENLSVDVINRYIDIKKRRIL